MPIFFLKLQLYVMDICDDACNNKAKRPFFFVIMFTKI